MLGFNKSKKEYSFGSYNIRELQSAMEMIQRKLKFIAESARKAYLIGIDYNLDNKEELEEMFIKMDAIELLADSTKNEIDLMFGLYMEAFVINTHEILNQMNEAEVKKEEK